MNCAECKNELTPETTVDVTDTFKICKTCDEQCKELKALCPNMDKIYRRDLGHDENPWQAWRDA